MNNTKVLIVDDEKDYLILMQERLASWGYEIAIATGGKEALNVIREKNPDIVILDYFMPDMDGTAVLREIRKFDMNLAVIMLTAHADIKNIKGAQGLGVSAFIPKISDCSDVMVSLRAALDLAQKKSD